MTPDHSSPATPDAATGTALTEAFAAFRSAAVELEAAYHAVSTEAAQLRRELAGTPDRPAAVDRNRQVAAHLIALLEALPAAVLVLDECGFVQQTNTAAGALLGTPLAGERWSDVRRRAFSEQRTEDGDLQLQDGRRIGVARRRLGERGGQVLLLTDVTERRRLEQMMQRHQRLAALGEMAASLAHQVRTPLAAALLYATNAQRPDISAQRREELLARSVSCMHDLETLIDDMLGFARGATSAQTRFTLASLLESVERQARGAVAPGQSLQFDCSDPAREIRGHRESLAGAVLNLVRNALEAAGEAGHVRVSGRLRGALAEITVSDDGPGVPADLRERIFEPFYTSRADGTGIGLSVARSVARSHGGDIVLLDGVARGTTFAVRLPADGGRAASPRRERAA